MSRTLHHPCGRPAMLSPRLLFPLRVLGVVLALLAPGLTGCDGVFKVGITHAPNKGHTIRFDQDPSPAQLRALGIDRQLRVEVGPPAASILVWVVEPRNRTRPKGTVLVIHGYRNKMLRIRDVARSFAEDGYRAILMDLRGHGRSTGQWITYGVVESRDLIQVMDRLEEKGLLEGRVGLWGICLGGVVGIKAAVVDRRLSAIVAVAPYKTLRSVLPTFIRNFAPGVGHLHSDQHLLRVLDDAAREAGFDPAEAECIRSIRKCRARVLIVHGKNDFWVPVSQAREIRAAAPDRTELFLMDWKGHIGAHWFSGEHRQRVLVFFNRHLARRR